MRFWVGEQGGHRTAAEREPPRRPHWIRDTTPTRDGRSVAGLGEDWARVGRGAARQRGHPKPGSDHVRTGACAIAPSACALDWFMRERRRTPPTPWDGRCVGYTWGTLVRHLGRTTPRRSHHNNFTDVPFCGQAKRDGCTLPVRHHSAGRSLGCADDAGAPSGVVTVPCVDGDHRRAAAPSEPLATRSCCRHLRGCAGPPRGACPDLVGAVGAEREREGSRGRGIQTGEGTSATATTNGGDMTCTCSDNQQITKGAMGEQPRRGVGQNTGCIESH